MSNINSKNFKNLKLSKIKKTKIYFVIRALLRKYGA